MKSGVNLFKHPTAAPATTPAPAAPGAPAGSPPGTLGSITAGEYTPDWKSLISNDPAFVAAQNQLAAGGVADLAGRNAAIGNAFTQFGQVPDLAALAQALGMSAADLQQAAGPAIAQMAKENTDAGTSTVARLNTANTDAIRQIQQELNKRGILYSGETGYQLDKQNTGYRGALSAANQKLLGYLQQYQQGFTAAEQARINQLVQAQSAAADRQYANNQGSSGFTATETSPGSGIYKGPDGKLYNHDGSLYTAPPPVYQPGTITRPGVAYAY